MRTHQEIVIDQFTRQAVPFSQSVGHTNHDSLTALMAAVRVTGNDTVLDMACGTGIVACAFATVARHVTGIDLTPAMLEQAALLADRRGLTNLAWVLGDIERLPFPDDSFSVVLSRYAFHHFVNPDAVVSEMVRVCCQTGKVVIADATPEPEKANAFNGFEKLFDPSHHRALTVAEFQGFLTRDNLRVVSLEHYTMEMELERHLADAFPNPGDDDKLRALVQADVGVNRLGVNARLDGEVIRYAYPVTVFVAEKKA